MTTTTKGDAMMDPRLPTDGTYLAEADDGTETLWPRALYPGLDDAEEAMAALYDWWRGDVGDQWRGRLVWAWQDAHLGEGWWNWTPGPHPPEERPAVGDPVLCWAVQ